MTTLPKKDLFRPDEAATYLGVSRATIYRMIESGKLKAVKISKKIIRINRKSLEKFNHTPA
ncbi:MAG: helix-turn-helix domain-containing protein [Sphaerochaeta sp.]|jgi:excisionase family DNA binding protein|nr:helix-turn-helix domain-containing protein [Sphaerochaeta sp.]